MSVRFIREDVALAHVKADLSGLISPDGQRLSPHQQLSVRVFVTNDDAWRIAGAQFSTRKTPAQAWRSSRTRRRIHALTT